MAIDRAPFNALVDDDGTNTTGTPWNKAAIKGVILDPVDAALAGVGGSVLSTSVTTGGAVALSGSARLHIVTCNNASDITISGFSATPINHGDRLVVWSGGAGHVYLAHATGNLWNFLRSGPTPLGASFGRAEYVFNGPTGLWMLQSHEQGAWITPPFNAANFGGSPGTWTVTAGNISSNRFLVRGCSITLDVAVSGATVGGSPSYLVYVLPNGYTVAGAAAMSIGACSDNGINQLVQVVPGGGGPNTFVARKDFATTAFINGVNTFSVIPTFPIN